MAVLPVNTVTDKFPALDQATLCPAKLFVIMSLFEGEHRLRTGAYPHYGECDDKVAQYLRKRIEAEQNDRYSSTINTLAAFKN
jgi:hypothetical protein